MNKIRIAIIVSEFNSDITFQMLNKAKDQAQKIKADIRYICFAPGSFDMPLLIEELLKKNDVDAAVTLGAVIKGETSHDDIVAENAARLIADLSLKYGKPIGLGITGPDMTLEQAKDRIDIVPLRAVNAAVNMAMRIKKLKEVRSQLGRTETIID
ncbi:MAG: 6,7-dimethyl-8-ribityllumazine synthase [Nitrososphaeraceae archaeon]|nr:6,7-dimethyl-8-ribityllumazine synthase [Nitrososphaeraceae archaeon]MCD6036970.1 6,7-dimethyl-8-ribityllumazine synthase [Nitrososphaeraceae archaeon]MDF2769756.1 6,7-dimethyl-8-ribityllumazine synthase [Nitrososphaeraceae archaeon]HKG89336.1 6,7-dimethyl-8-ribityllumazine synthase [Nitrososphaeraceae archaeon]